MWNDNKVKGQFLALQRQVSLHGRADEELRVASATHLCSENETTTEDKRGATAARSTMLTALESSSACTVLLFVGPQTCLKTVIGKKKKVVLCLFARSGCKSRCSVPFYNVMLSELSEHGLALPSVHWKPSSTDEKPIKIATWKKKKIKLNIFLMA